MSKLSDLKVNLSPGVRPSRVLCDYVMKPFVNFSRYSALFNELTSDMPVVRCSYSVEYRVYIQCVNGTYTVVTISVYL